jgi:hypothetical protein
MKTSRSMMASWVPSLTIQSSSVFRLPVFVLRLFQTLSPVIAERVAGDGIRPRPQRRAPLEADE